MGSPNQHDMAGIELIVNTLRVGAKKPGDVGTLVTAEGINFTPIQSTGEVTDVDPLASELTAAFGAPDTVGPGFIATVNDGGADTGVYLVVSSGTSWYYVPLIKAL